MDCIKRNNNVLNGEDRQRYRTCTDTIWLAIYITFWLFLVVIAVFSFVYGNPLRIINGYDSFGNICGVSRNEQYSNLPQSGQNMIDKPELFYFDIKELRKAIKICVKECPQTTIGTPEDLFRYYEDTQTQLCRYDFNMSIIAGSDYYNIERFFNYLGPCPAFPIFESFPILHRCVPKAKNAPIHELYKMLNSWDITQQFLGDIYSTWHIIAILCGIALLMSIALITLMHLLSKIVSWLICTLVIVASIFLTVALWYGYYNIRNSSKVNSQYSMLEEFVRNENAMLVLAILATITMIVLLLAIYFLKNKLSGLSALFEEASACMMNLPGLLVAPLIAFIVLISFLVFWVLVVVCIVTASAPGQNQIAAVNNGITQKGNISTAVVHDEFIEAKTLRSMFWIYIVGLIWTTEFIFGCQQFALAAAVAYWYFEKPTKSPTTYAIGKLLKYHLGTVAKGSLVITLFKIPRLLLTYLYAKLKKRSDKGSDCAKCCLSCCSCGFWLLERFIRFLNHNAYTVVAIESINFCPAAGIAWNAMASNALQVATVNSIGDFILFLGKIIVASLCGLVGIFMLKDNPSLHFYMAPVILIIIFTFFIAHIILSLFEMVVDTLFLCVCEDKTINGRSGRWTQSNLGKLINEDPIQSTEESPVQVVEMMPINKQPFRVTKIMPSESEKISE